MPALAVEISAARNDLAMGQPGCASFVIVTLGLSIVGIHKNHIVAYIIYAIIKCEYYNNIKI